MYIEYEKRETEYKKELHDFDYKYTGRVFYGTGTSINNFFNGVSKGIAYYDPAHSIYKDGKSKQRPQWRVTSKSFFENISIFYDKFEDINLV